MKLKFDVTGMTCAACSARVEKVTKAVAGVEKVEVNLLAGKMTVEAASDVSAAIEKAVLTKVKDGDIILFHDMSDSSVKAALDIVDALLKQDYEFVTVSELARLRGIKPRPGVTYKKFPVKEDNIK